MSVPPAPELPAIELRGISKRFGAIDANRDVDLTVRRGTVHGIVGENGAGKSTLMAILHGFHRPDAGAIRVGGQEVSFRNSRDAIARGIDMVHQHFMLVDRFTVLENVTLGTEGGTLLARGARRARAELARLGSAYGLQVDPDAIVGSLPVGAQQRVEILKALYRGAETLILDEPTGVLTPQEADDLFRVVRALRGQGRTVLLITHKLREVMAVTDRVSVMRGGRVVAERDTADTSPAELGELMIGRRLAPPVPRRQHARGPAVLSAHGLELRDASGAVRVQSVDIALHAGEIIGVAGVSGNGQSELLEALAGMLRPSGGEIRLRGRPVFPGAGFDAAALRRAGVAHVPEDRLRCGLLRRESAAASAVLGYQADPALRRAGLLSPPAVAAHAARLMAALDVRPPDPRVRSGLLSGGNAQKLVLARELDRAPAVLLVGQPTRGVDVGGIDAIHRRLLAARDAGCAVLVVSVELDEIMALADRIVVMSGGRIAGEVAAAAADERRLGLLMAGVGPGVSGDRAA